MNIHDWQRVNKQALAAFNKWFEQQFGKKPLNVNRREVLLGFLGCWELLKPFEYHRPDIRKPGKAWNGKERCGKPIKRMHYHKTEADAVCDLPKMDGSSFCRRHTKKEEEKEPARPKLE